MDKELKLILPKRTSILHYIFCYFIAQCLLEIKNDLFNEIIYTSIIKYFNKKYGEAHSEIIIKVIHIFINIIIISIVVFFVFLRKKIRIKRIKSIHKKKPQNPIKNKLQKKSKK
jgi:hypothetical protein